MSTYKCPSCGASGHANVGGTSYSCGSYRGPDMNDTFRQSNDCKVAEALKIMAKKND